MEEWKPIVGYEGTYDVSNLGRIKRVGLPRDTRHSGGTKIGRILTLQAGKYGYLRVILWKDGGYRLFLAHRLVAIAFLGKIPENHEVNHLDGNKQNNSILNLEYVTRSENNKHAYRTGLMHKGDNHCNACLTSEQVIQIVELHDHSGLGYRKLGQMFGVERTTIQAIIKGRSWSHLTGRLRS